MARYGKKAQDTVESAMHRYKKGSLKSGSGKKVASRKQAIAIGLSEAREKGAKVPPAKKRKSSTAKKSRKTSVKKTASRKTGAKKTSRKSSARKTKSSRS